MYLSVSFYTLKVGLDVDMFQQNLDVQRQDFSMRIKR